jgi:hypothetical protein
MNCGPHARKGATVVEIGTQVDRIPEAKVSSALGSVEKGMSCGPYAGKGLPVVEIGVEVDPIR